MTTQSPYQQARSVFREHLTYHGAIISVPHRGLDPKRVRIMARKAATAEGMQIELRTCDGQVYARRIDTPAPRAMPGASEPSPTVTIVDVYRAMTPWPDDPYYTEKMKVIRDHV